VVELLEQMTDYFRVQQALQTKGLLVAQELLSVQELLVFIPLVVVVVRELLVATQLQAQTAVRVAVEFPRLSQELLWQEAVVAVVLRV
jgi:hypothetical protein